MRPILVLAALAVTAGSGRAADQPAAIELRGDGVQIYRCAAAGAGFAWRLLGPEATLTTAGGEPAGRHYAGPSWQAPDGSIVVGEVLVASPSPQAGSIPWLLLRAKSHAGDGRFGAVGFIARTRTEGGAAPASGCDADHIATETRVAYSATYTLFPAAAASQP